MAAIFNAFLGEAAAFYCRSEGRQRRSNSLAFSLKTLVALPAFGRFRKRHRRLEDGQNENKFPKKGVGAAAV